MDRAAIHDLLRGTHDIARAAELLAASNDITYWQQEFQGQHVPGDFNGSGDKLRNANHLNCFEFVHLCNVLTCCSDHPGNLGTSNLDSHLLDLTAGLNKWDGSSPIPRGSVVVGTKLPPWGVGAQGVFHVGVAVGDGHVVSNLDRNVTNEPIADVFGGLGNVDPAADI